MKEIDKAKDCLRMIAYREDPRSNNLIVELTDVMTILDELKSDLLHDFSTSFICHSCGEKHSGKNDDQMFEVCKNCF
jgi:hypothetical protein